MTLGAVLAGGRSSRFGSDKASARWRGRALIDHVVDALATVADDIVICGRAHGDRAALADRPSAGLGPLAAINAALHHAAGHGFDRVLTLPCDVPAVAPGLLARLLHEVDAAYYDAVPVIGIWPARLAAALDASLVGGGDRSIRRWARGAGATPLLLLPGETPVNVNRPEDFAALGA